MKLGRNLVLCGFTQDELKKIKLYDVRYLRKNAHYDEYWPRFPYLITVDTMKDAMKHHGYMIIIKSDIDATYLTSIEKEYRFKFKNFNIIILYNSNYKYKNRKKYSKLIIYSYNKMFYSQLSQSLDEDYIMLEEKLKKRVLKISNKRKVKLDELAIWMKLKRYFRTDDVVKEFGYTKRSVERYINILYELGHDIGYDYLNKNWYYVK